MTPHQIELVQSSFNLVVPNLESAAMTFYGNPGETLYMGATNTGGLAGGCSLSMAGYYVDLP